MGRKGDEGQGILNPILGKTEWNRGALMEALAEEPGGRGRYSVLCLACPSTEEMRVGEVAQKSFPSLQWRPLPGTEPCRAICGSSHLPLPNLGTGTEVNAELQAPVAGDQLAPDPGFHCIRVLNPDRLF